MKRLLVLAALLAIIVACAAVANATPTLSGATGGVALPDVKTTPTGVLDLSLTYQRQELDTAEEATHATATYGLSSNAELGLKYTWQAGNGTTGLNNWGANLKYAMPIKFMDLDIAAGMNYAKYKDLGTNQFQAYVVGGANVWQSYDGDKTLDFNIGLNWTKFETTGSDIQRFRAFTVLDYGFRNNLHMVGEFQSEAKMDSDPLSSLAIRYNMDENLSWQFGITNAFRGVTGGDEHNWFLGANYSLSQFHEK